MTKEMALDAWGEPDDINKTVTANLVQEQWVYGHSSFLLGIGSLLLSRIELDRLLSQLERDAGRCGWSG